MNVKRILFTTTVLMIISLYPIYGVAVVNERQSENYVKIGFTVENNTLYNLKLVERKIDRGVDIFAIFQKINEVPKTGTIQTGLNEGYIILLTLEPWSGYDVSDNYTIYEPSAILNGSIDDDIKKWDTFFKSLKYEKGKLVVRVGHEVNGNWYPWAVFWRNNTIKSASDEYNYIAGNLTDKRLLKMWAVNRKTFGYLDEWVPYESYYPGDENVDLIGISVYNRRPNNFRGFNELIRTIYKDLNKFNKPLWISEMSTVSSGGDKAKWIHEAYTSIRDEYPNIKAVIWFNEGKIFDGNFKDWAFDSTPESGIAFKNSIKFENLKRG